MLSLRPSREADDTRLPLDADGVQHAGQHGVVPRQEGHLDHLLVVVARRQRRPGGVAEPMVGDELVGGPQHGGVLGRPPAVGPGRHPSDVVIAETGVEADPDVLAPLVVAAAQPRRPQDRELPVARGSLPVRSNFPPKGTYRRIKPGWLAIVRKMFAGASSVGRAKSMTCWTSGGLPVAGSGAMRGGMSRSCHSVENGAESGRNRSVGTVSNASGGEQWRQQGDGWERR